MNLLQSLKGLYQTLTGSQTIFSVPVDRQRRFLEQIPQPQDDWARSYAQYRCQCFLMKRGVPLLLNCAAMVMLPVYTRKLRRQTPPAPSEKTGSALLFFGGSERIVPDSLRREFEIVPDRDFQQHLLLTAEDLHYLGRLRKRYPLSFYFRFKCMAKIAMYRSAVTCCSPKAVICSEEYSFTSSLLTDYCRMLGVEHINIMHGEKLYYIRDSFFRFDRCYVWDNHYAELFRDMRAAPEQFRVEVPPSLRLEKGEPVSDRVDFTYYLGNETTEQVICIIRSLAALQARGYRTAIRPHPVYHAHSEFLFQDAQGLIVEKANEFPIEESLWRTGHVVSLYSTVLLQGIFNGIPVLIDDLTDPPHYQQLKQMRFLAMEQPHTLLSQWITSDPPNG